MANLARREMLILGLAAGVFAVATPASATDPPTKIVYQVQHAKYGDVGTYTNSIERTADGTKVTTQGRMKVSVLGIPAYRHEFDRVENWEGARLVNFHGVTTKNGERAEVKGEATGDQFTLTTPTGTAKAPSDVKVVNPWSEAVLEAKTVLMPEVGRLDKVSVSGGEPATIKVNGRDVATRLYQIHLSESPKRYEVWFDEGGIPVRFADLTDDEPIIFNLTECEGADPCPSYSQKPPAGR